MARSASVSELYDQDADPQRNAAGEWSMVELDKARGVISVVLFGWFTLLILAVALVVMR